MKKLIAISVMCALIVGAAFAETTVGGQVFVGGAFAQGDNVENSKVNSAAIGNDEWNTSLKISFSEGSAGGRIRILGKNSTESNIFDEWFGWWRPIPQLRIQVGSNQDGDFGTAQISGWGFTGENKNNGGNQGAMAEYNGYNEGRNHSRNTGWYGGTGGTPNLQFTINAVDNLTINLWFPWDSNGNIGLTLAKFNAQIQYRIVDVGNISLSFESNTGYLEPVEKDSDAWYGAAGVTNASQSPKVFASFYLVAIDNMGVDLGVAYKFPFNDTDNEIVTNHPFEVGLGYRFGAGDFGFKLRASASLGSSVKVGSGDPVNGATEISASILPSYKIGTVTLFLYAGLGIQSVEKWEDAGGNFATNESNSVTAWFVNPFVFIPAGGLRFKVGFQLYSDGVKANLNDNPDLDGPKVQWSIPFGFYTYL